MKTTVMILLIFVVICLASTDSFAEETKYDVALSLKTLDVVRNPDDGNSFPTGPFYVQGTIYTEGTLNSDGTVPPNAKRVGIFRCWGWFINGTTGTRVVTSVYHFDRKGEVIVQGVDDSRMIVVGSTGAFTNLREAKVQFINPANFTFQVDFL
ncbi:hypothetical protein L0152_14665 [bacterium]|nr:hypothetical protein [bacterium]